MTRYTAELNQDASDAAAAAADNNNKDNQHPEETSFIVKYEDQEYDIASFLRQHPGGRTILLPLRGKDIKEEFEEVGHSGKARRILNRLAIESTDKTKVMKVKELKSWQFVLKKLVTPEDPHFLHKTFGILSLLSFLYRYLVVLPMKGTLGMDGTVFDHLTLLVHFVLSFSSLIFHVIKHRIPDRPLIIYEEYRLHAIAFSTGSVVLSLAGMHAHSLHPIARRIIFPMIVCVLHMITDRITKIHGKKGVTAVRNDGTTPRALALFYSFYQIAAIASHVVWNDRMGDLGYNTLIAIQSSAFLMTLKRKSLIRWYMHAFWYSLALAFSYFIMWKVKGAMFFVYPLIVFYVRVSYRVNKYILWGIYTVAIHYVPV